MLCSLSTPLPLRTPHAGMGVPGSAVGDDLGELRAVVPQRRQLRLGAAQATCAGRQYGCSSARLGVDLLLGVAARVVLLTTKAPCRRRRRCRGSRRSSSDLVLSYAGDCRAGEEHRAALDRAVLEPVAGVGLAERLPDEVGDERDDRDHQRDERDAEHALEVRAFEHVVVEERREVLGLLRLRVPPQAHDAVRDEDRAKPTTSDQVDEDQVVRKLMRGSDHRGARARVRHRARPRGSVRWCWCRSAGRSGGCRCRR